MRKLILPLALIILTCSTGCTYMKDRVLDFSDIFIVKAYWGMGLGAGGHITQFAGTVVGTNIFRLEREPTLIHCTPTRLRDFKNHASNGNNRAWEHEMFCGIGVLGLVGHSLPVNDYWEKRIEDDLIANYYFAGINPFGYRWPYHRWLDSSCFVFVGLAGVRVGVSPGELTDFLLGWTTLDIAGDDGHAEKEETDRPTDDRKESGE